MTQFETLKEYQEYQATLVKKKQELNKERLELRELRRKDTIYRNKNPYVTNMNKKKIDVEHRVEEILRMIEND